jgi:predicted ATPase
MTGVSSGESLQPEPSVLNFGEWFAGVIAHAPAAYTRMETYLKQVMYDIGQIRNPVVAPDSRGLFVDFISGSGRATIPFADLSDGEKSFMICSLVLGANSAYGPILCYWDEPDCYLAPNEIGHLTMALRQAFDVAGQLIVTSHNPETVRRFSDENTILLHRVDHASPTQMRALSEIEFEGDLIGALISGDIEL